MPVLSLPVMPETLRPILRTPIETVTYWKAIDTGRARAVSHWRLRIRARLHTEFVSLILPTVERALSPGHAVVLLEQTLFAPAHLAPWEELSYQLYGTVGNLFARRVAEGLKAQIAAETKADPQVEAGLGDAGLEDRWLSVVADWLSTNAGERIRSIQATTLHAVRSVLEQGARDGASIPRIATTLRAAEPSLMAVRAVTIARTEVIAASNLGARAGAIDTGLKLDHEWIATPGRRTRPAHLAASGQTRPMEEPFVVMGERLLFPGDSSLGASAKNLVNCRCAVGYKPTE